MCILNLLLFIIPYANFYIREVVPIIPVNRDPFPSNSFILNYGLHENTWMEKKYCILFYTGMEKPFGIKLFLILNIYFTFFFTCTNNKSKSNFNKSKTEKC